MSEVNGEIAEVGSPSALLKPVNMRLSKLSKIGLFSEEFPELEVHGEIPDSESLSFKNVDAARGQFLSWESSCFKRAFA